MTDTSDAAVLLAARAGDPDAFAKLVEPYRGELHAHCYRMLRSAHDADDALQDTLLNAWRGLSAFEGRSALRSWLYRIATNAALTVAARRRPGTSISVEPHPLVEVIPPDGAADPAARYDERERVEQAFVAALEHLPATQRAALIMRDVFAFPAADVADCLDRSVASITSALQRAREKTTDRQRGASRRVRPRAGADDGQRERVDAFVAAWERADVDALVAMLAQGAAAAS